MESLLVAWRFFLLATVLFFPQLLGILLYFRLRRRVPRWLSAILAALAPAIIFFWLERIFIIAELTKLYESGERCGMPAMGAVLLLYAGTFVSLWLGIIAQLLLAAPRHR